MSNLDDTLNKTTAEMAQVKKKKKLLNGTNITFNYPSGSKYVGSFKDGKLQGYGIYTYSPSGDVYEGEWKADLKHGHGSYHYANGDKYIGEWYMGKKHGKGRFLFTTGDEYSGAWKEDKMDGYGVFKLALNGNRYEGYWKEGIREGMGILFYGNGDVYDGQWERGKENGFGILSQSNDDTYCGGWSDGLMDGKGLLRERGVLYYVEYMGGYVISKVAIDSEENTEVDVEYMRAKKKYVEWEKSGTLLATHNNKEAIKRHVSEKVSADPNVESLQTENALLKKRVEDLADTLVAKRTADKASSDAMTTEQLRVSIEQANKTEEELRKMVADLKTKVRLLEGSLGERTLEQRRLKDDLRAREAEITQLRMDIEQLQSISRSPSPAKGLRSSPSPLPDRRMSHSVGNGASPEELLEYNAELLKINSELQKKNSFLMCENAKLTAQSNVLEERADDAAAELDKVRKEFEKVCLENEDLRNSLKTQLEKSAEKNGKHDNKADQSVNGQSPRNSTSDPAAVAAKSGKASNEKKLSTTSADVDKQLEDLMAQIKESNRMNVELTVKNDALTKKLGEQEAKMRSTTASTRNESLQKALEETAKEVETLRQQLKASEKSNEMNKQILEETRQRYSELDNQLNDMSKRKAADPSIVKSIEDKMERIAALERENAQLARELDEAQGQVAEDLLALKSEKKSQRLSIAARQNVEEEMEKMQKDVKKAQKKLKKAVAERNAMAMDLYETQLNLARSDRTLQQINGGVMVAVRLCKNNSSSGQVAVQMSDADASRIVLLDNGNTKEYQFDYCCGSEETPETFFTELRRPLSLVASGFQVGIITMGEFHTGKSTFLKSLLPLMVEHLSGNCAEGESAFSVTYKVAVVDISAEGAMDCETASPIARVMHDDHGSVVPEGATFVECKDVSVLGVLFKLMKQRVNITQRSHTWMQIQRIKTHKVDLTYTTGRLTLFDLCGAGPLEAQKDDQDSARFANRSFQGIKDVLKNLADKSPTVPYEATVETSLLFDLLGGNSLTSVIGTLHPSAEHREESLRTLGALDFLSKVRNGPLYQDFVSADQLRWRDAISALRSDEQAQPQLFEVDNVRGSLAAD